jgi:hypothetical protein
MKKETLWSTISSWIGLSRSFRLRRMVEHVGGKIGEEKIIAALQA